MRNNPNRQPRCPRCRMTWSLCVCDLAPRLSLRTRVAVIMHVSEIVRSSNTGHVVPMVLANSFVCLRGIKDRPTETAGMVPAGSQGLVLYPSSDSQELTADYLRNVRQPVTLVVLDGNWRQAAKMLRHVTGLDGLPRVRLAAGPASRFRLRAQFSPARVCTFEAAARALGTIEGAEVQARLEEFLTIMVERMLWARGKLRRAEVAGGIPAAARAQGYTPEQLKEWLGRIDQAGSLT